MSDNQYRIPDVIVDFQILSEIDVTAAVPWHLADLGMPKFWKTTGAGKGVKVAVLDTGLQGPNLHPETKDRTIKVLSTVGDDGFDRGRSSHGQHCSGLVVGKHCGGAPEADLISIKVMKDNGEGSESAVAQGIHMAIKEGADIISMSLGAPAAGRAMMQACAAAYEAGVICVAATGNDARASLSYPAAFDDYCLAVGAIDRQKRRASFSNYSSQQSVDMVDYGVQIVSSVLGGGYQNFSGTSMATPLGVSKIANFISFARQLGAWAGDIREKYALLGRCCEDLGRSGRDGEYGWGLVDPRKAYDPSVFPPKDSDDKPAVPPVSGPPTGAQEGDQVLYTHVRRGNKVLMVFPDGREEIVVN